MKLLPLAWKNALRNKRRTILTVLGIALFVGIICFMQTVVTSIDAWEGAADQYSRVAVMSKANLTARLPRAHEEYLKSLPEVELVQKSNWFGGIISDRREDFFANFANDTEGWLDIWEEYSIPPEQYRAWQEDRQGVIVGKRLAEKFDWPVGKRIVLKGTIYPVNPELNVSGIYDGPETMAMYFHWEYFNQLMDDKGTVGVFWLKGRSKEDVPTLIATVDQHFENSTDPTKTMSEKEFARMFSSMMGNIALLVATVGTVVVVIMVLIVGNTLTLSARERAAETSTMRTLGFSRGAILWMTLAESVIVTAVGTAIGLGIPVFLFNVLEIPMGMFFPVFTVAASTMILAGCIALVVGLGAGIIPAWMTARLNIVEGLRRTG